MEFEKIKAAWQEKKFEGYLFEKPPSRIEADIRRKAMELKNRHAAADVLRVLGNILLIGIWVFLYDTRQPLPARTGMILLMIGMALEGLAYLWMRFRYRGERFDLPRVDFLRREQKRIKERILLERASFTWLAAPALAGCVLYMIAVIPTIGEVLSSTAVIAVMWVGLIWVNGRRIRKQMVPILEEIDRRLGEVEGTGA